MRSMVSGSKYHAPAAAKIPRPSPTQTGPGVKSTSIKKSIKFNGLTLEVTGAGARSAEGTQTAQPVGRPVDRSVRSHSC